LRLRTAAAAVSLVNGAWLVYAGWFWLVTFFFPIPISAGSPPVASSTNPELLALGIILVLDSVLCFLDWDRAFYASSVLSALGVLDILLAGPSPSSPYFVTAVFLLAVSLGAVTIVLDVVAARRRTFVPEADHPLNLPVFG
jgi:hypothetical protein